MLDTNLFETRLLTAAELALIIASQRAERGWSQETLAELAGVNVRTIQRVEKAEPSTIDTRRALARAFEWPDLDIFNKQWPIPNEERLKSEQDRIERETVAVAVETVTTGRALREFAERAESWMLSQMGEIGNEAAIILAELQDYFTDYGDINDCYSATQKLDVNADFQGMIDRLAAHGIGIVAGMRRVKLSFHVKGPMDTMRLTIVYVVAGPATALPATIRVARSGNFGL